MATSTRLLSGNTNPYASEAVVFDSSAPVQYYLQQQAHQAAKEEATDKYLQGMLEVDDKGMRNNERPDLIGMRTKLQDQYIKNRDLILHPEKDNGKALLEYRGAIQGMKSFVNKSAAEKEEDKRIATLSDWAKKEGLKTPDDVMNVIQKRNYSINDPRFHKDPQAMTGGYTSSDIEPFYKPFGTKEQTQWIDATMSGIKPDEVEHPNKKPIVKDGLLYTYKINQFGKDKLAQIGNSANTLYDNVPAAKRYFESEFKDPNELIKYNQIFKNQYGKDIQNPRDVAVAWTLSKVPPPIESFDTREDPNAYIKKLNYAASIRRPRVGSQKDANEELVQIKTQSEPLEKNHVFVSNENSRDGKKWYKAGMKTAFLTPTLQNTLSTQLTDEEGKTYDFKPKEVIISEDGKYFAPLVKVPMYKNIETGEMTEKPPSGWTDTDKKVKKVDVVSKPKFWLTEKQMAAEIQKSFPKGEGNVDLGIDEEGAFVSPENVAPRPNTPRARQEAAKASSNKKLVKGTADPKL